MKTAGLKDLREDLMKIVHECPGSVSFTILSNDESLSWEENRRISSASLIKLPIMMAAFEQIQTGSQTCQRNVRCERNPAPI